MKTTTVPLGAVLLATAVKRRGLTPHGFATAYGFCRIQFAKTLRGELRRVSVDFALDIEALTNGEVPVASWRMRVPRTPKNIENVPASVPCAPGVPSDRSAEASR